MLSACLANGDYTKALNIVTQVCVCVCMHVCMCVCVCVHVRDLNSAGILSVSCQSSGISQFSKGQYSSKRL